MLKPSSPERRWSSLAACGDGLSPSPCWGRLSKTHSECESPRKLYFEHERGYPKEGEPAAYAKVGRPLTRSGLLANHLYKMRKLGYIKKIGNGTSDRYGYGLHELRDLARSVLEKARGEKLDGKGEAFNPLSAEFWMGHSVDPLYYNKIWQLDPEYNLTQYRTAERYLNVVGGSTIRPELDTGDIVKALIRDPEMRQFIRSVTQDMDDIAKLGHGKVTV